MKNLEWRVAALGAVGVGVAGAAQTGWWVLLAATAEEGTRGLWGAVAGQILLTVTIAVAVAWQARREVRAVQPSLRLLAEQLGAIDQGRAAPDGHPPLPEAATLAQGLHRLSRRLLAGERGSAEGTSHRSGRRDPATGLLTRFGFTQRLTERLVARDRPETAVVLLRCTDDQELGAQLQALRDELHDDADAFAGRLADDQLALCLPQHRRVDATVARLMAAAPSGARWQLRSLDHLGGRSPGSVAAALDAAWSPQAEAPTPVAADAIAAALQASRVRLGEFRVQGSTGALLHLECPLRLQLVDGGPWEPADRWLAVASGARLAPQVDLHAVDLALGAIVHDAVDRCVHVSADSLAAAGFVDAVRQRLQAQPDAARRLWIEVAEVPFERLPAPLRQAVTVWRRCGVRVGVEHAGTGVRSLVRLDDLALDYVKIDRRFVQGVARDAEQRDWVRALAACARDSGALVLAEGADAAADLQMLWQLGFDGATGRAVGAVQEPLAAPGQAMSPV